MIIEIFPAEKSCEQGCTTCPLARKNRNILATAIDSEVQKTFSYLEKVLKQKNTPYHLNFTSTFNLFPSLEHPELITMARFETNKDVVIQNNPEDFSNNIGQLLMRNAINPKIIGFSFVPTHPILTQDDSTVVKRIITEIAKWHFSKKYHSIQATVRSNLIGIDLFNEVKHQLFDSDKRYLKGVLPDGFKLNEWKRKAPFSEGEYEYLYYNHYGAKKGTQSIEISNRVISPKKMDDIHSVNSEQAQMLYPRTKENIHFAIAPKGVMFRHSSIWINNPILWVSHADFRSALGKELKKSNFSFLRFLQELFVFNTSLYQVILKHTQKGQIIPPRYFMDSFEKHRVQYGK